MKPPSQTKPIESTPISTIKEELRENLNRFEKYQNESNSAQAEHIIGNNKRTYFNLVVLCKDLKLSEKSLHQSVEKNLGSLLESHDMLEAAMRWVPVSEKLPEVPIPQTKYKTYSHLVSIKFIEGQTTGRYDGSMWWDNDCQRQLTGVIGWRELIA